MLNLFHISMISVVEFLELDNYGFDFMFEPHICLGIRVEACHRKVQSRDPLLNVH